MGRIPLLARLALSAPLALAAWGGFCAQSPPGTERDGGEAPPILMEAPPISLENQPLPTGTALRFQDAVDEALARNLGYAQAQAREAAVAGRGQSAVQDLFPTMDVGLSASRTTGVVQGSFGDFKDSSFHTYAAPHWTVAYQLNLGARIEEALASSKEARAATYQTQDARQRLLLAVTRAYQRLTLAWHGLNISQKLEMDSASFLTLTLDRFEAGVGEGAIVERARAKLALDRSQRLRAEALWEGASVDLAVMLRRDPTVFLVPEDTALRPAQWVGREGPAEVADTSARPDVKGALMEAEAAKLRFGAARWDLFAPKLALWWTGSRISDTWGDFRSGRRTGAALYWSFALGQIGRMRTRRAEAEESALRSSAAAERAAGEAVIASQNLEAALQTQEQARIGLEAAERGHGLSLARFQGGLATALEVFDAEDTLAQARFNFARTISDGNVSQAELLAAQGRLDRAALLRDSVP